MIVRIHHPQQLRAMMADLTKCFEDFLRRSGEVFGVIEQWAAVMRTLASPEADRYLMLLALDQRVRPIGYVIAETGYDWWGVHLCSVIQLYTKGRGPARAELMQSVEQWAKEQECQVLTAVSRRDPKSVARTFDGKVYGITFVRMLTVPQEENSNGETPANQRAPAAAH